MYSVLGNLKYLTVYAVQPGVYTVSGIVHHLSGCPDCISACQACGGGEKLVVDEVFHKNKILGETWDF